MFTKSYATSCLGYDRKGSGNINSMNNLNNALIRRRINKIRNELEKSECFFVYYAMMLRVNPPLFRNIGRSGNESLIEFEMVDKIQEYKF